MTIKDFEKLFEEMALKQPRQPILLVTPQMMKYFEEALKDYVNSCYGITFKEKENKPEMVEIEW